MLFCGGKTMEHIKTCLAELCGVDGSGIKMSCVYTMGANTFLLLKYNITVPSTSEVKEADVVEKINGETPEKFMDKVNKKLKEENDPMHPVKISEFSDADSTELPAVPTTAPAEENNSVMVAVII